MLGGSLTAFTTSRIWRIASTQSYLGLSGQRIPLRSFSCGARYSDTFSFIRKLLTSHKSEKREGTSPVDEQTKSSEAASRSEQHGLQIVPEFKFLEYTNPTERWRDRGRLGTVPEAGESRVVGKTTDEIHLFNEEAHFLKSDRKAFEPPYLKEFAAQRRLEFLDARRMKSFVQVLTTPTADTPGTTLLLHFDNKRYLIGSLGEGTQRASVQAGARLLKVSECFITGRAEWSNIGGIMGMILTLADMAGTSRASTQEEAKKRAQNEARRRGVAQDSEEMAQLEEQAKLEVARNTLTFFAPPNTEHTLATARRFIFRKGMPVSVHEFRGGQTYKAEDEEEWAPYWADQNIKVWPMSILPTDASPTPSPSHYHPKAVSPRKRSHDEIDADEQSEEASAIADDELTETERGQLTAKAVVAEMFDSSWRLDTLYPTRLANVKMPAVIFRRNPDTNKIERYSGPAPGGKKPLEDPNLEVLVRRPWPGALVQNLPPTRPAKEAISYIIRNHTQRGKFNPKAAMDLKVPKGVLWSKLSSGESVQNENGETITADQVLGKSKEGGGVAIIHLPDQSYIDNLIARPEWREPKVMAGVGAVVWMCGAGVATDDRLRKFMREFKDLEHVISSPDYCANNIAFDSAAASTVRLGKVDEKRYQVPAHNSRSATQTHIDLPLPDNASHAVRGQVVQLEPQVGVHTKDMIPLLDIAATEAEMSDEVLREAANAKQAIQSDQAAISKWAESLPDPNVEITTLGTGSALPSKYRNVSATLMQVPGWGNMLWDAGENTIGQLKRVFPPKKFEQVLRDLRMISISHMHADHHLGTVGVIKAWYDLVHDATPASLPSIDADATDLLKDQNRLTVLGEATMQHWLHEYSAVEDYGFSRLAPICISPASPQHYTLQSPSKMNWFVPPNELAKAGFAERRAMLAASAVAPDLFGLKDVQAVHVRHCHGARATSITWPNGFKASYSGDCRPSKDFVHIGKGSTVCIHEATFDDELQGDAEAKNHSTTSEALGVAQGMGAKACVLTHFSQRYQKLPVLEHSNGDTSEGAAVTQDVPMLSSDDPADYTDISPNPDDNMSYPLADAEAAESYTVYKPPSFDADEQTDLSAKPANGTSSAAKAPAVKLKLQSDMKVCVAFDYMRVRLGDLAELQHFTPALLKLFAEDEKREGEASGAAAVEEEAGGNGKKLKKGKMPKQPKQEKKKKKGEEK